MDKTLPVHITILEMITAPATVLHVPTKPSIALIQAKNIPLGFYRYLYEIVGKPHHWEERRELEDDSLDAIINSSKSSISVLYADGCPAGFFELDHTHMPETNFIKYLGLAPQYQGLGLGNWFVGTAIRAAWSTKPAKVRIETNTLDHPAALRLYQKHGFSPIAVADSEVKIWE